MIDILPSSMWLQIGQVGTKENSTQIEVYQYAERVVEGGSHLTWDRDRCPKNSFSHPNKPLVGAIDPLFK